MDQDGQQDAAASEKQTLSEVRERALKALSEIIPQIEEIDPVERFNITLEAVRSTDNKQLLYTALDAATRIEDKRVQANSLLDLIREADFLIDQLDESKK